MYATRGGNAEAVKLLLDYGADYMGPPADDSSTEYILAYCRLQSVSE
ncbi:MAG: ankyrin repeat domain-containing protein [Synergistaceae bacterium]|nr:ankyrin repeat domain-containing protein [Synergistaceae bacterium]